MLPSFISDLGRGFLNNDILSIDIGFTNIKVVHSRKKNGNQLKIINFGIGSTPNGCIKNGIISNLDGVADNLKKVINEHRINERNVKFVISAGSNIISKIIFIPKDDSKKVEDKIRNEIMKHSLVDINTQKLFYRVTGETEREGEKCLRALVTIVPNTTIENYVKLIKLLNFKPIAIEIPFSSVARFFSKGVNVIDRESRGVHNMFYHIDSGATAVIDLGSETTNLSILNAGALEFNRVILSGGRSLDEIIGKKLGVRHDIAERYKKMHGIVSERHMGDEIENIVDTCIREYIGEIMNNVKRSIEFYVNKCDGQAVERIFFIGGGSEMKGLRGFARDIMQKPVFSVENMNFNSIEFGNNLDKDKIRYLVNAVGLAM
ncbi:MAG: pilus assembly protein PilM [Clostridia bacterium]|nr:pilus assembly protein PilM [Clostridia bacterium]